MLFSSISFLFVFLALFLLIYYLLPKKLKNAWLLFSSLFFYFVGEPKYTVLMLFSALSGYVHGLLIERATTPRRRKGWLVSSIVLGLAALGFFKYADFAIGNFNALFHLDIPLLHLALPIGISFYTFQSLSYTVDVYRKDAPAQRSFIDFAAYLTMFPQLIAGPIVRYASIAEQLATREHTLAGFAYGVRRFVIGLAKKVLIANALGELAALGLDTGLYAWMYAIAYSLQIYFDFSGYSDMAIGLGSMFGFHFNENFNYPFISKSITEFWRRWHMSLGSWFRDYVYIPLGGNRVSKPRWLFNILVVWALTGLWHGASWNFVLWGLYFAVLLALEKVFLKKLLDKTRFLRHVYVLLTVLVSFVIFSFTDPQGIFTHLGAMFGGASAFADAETLYYLRSFALTLLVGIIGSTPLCASLCHKLENIRNPRFQAVFIVLECCTYVVLLLCVTAALIDGTFNPFLYFRF